MGNTKTKVLKNANDVIVGYRITKKDGEVFDIPVLDNRNPKHQERIATTIKERNTLQGSKFLNPSFSAWGYTYNTSMKGRKGF